MAKLFWQEDINQAERAFIIGNTTLTYIRVNRYILPTIISRADTIEQLADDDRSLIRIWGSYILLGVDGARSTTSWLSSTMTPMLKTFASTWSC